VNRVSGRWFLVLLALVVVAFAIFYVRRTTIVLDAPEPVIIPETADTLPRLPPSLFEAPVTYDLSTAIDSIEAAVPLTYGDLEERITLKNNHRVRFAYHLRRSPFRVKVRGQTVTISSNIEYSGRIWYDSPIGPEIEVSCGTDDELPRRARLTLESTGMLSREWGLRTRSRVVRLEALSDSARDRCRLSFLRLDVTDRVLERTQEMLEEKLARFDEAVARWPVRTRFEKIWRDLQKPVRLADSVYLTINPLEAQIGEIGAIDETAYAELRLVASPRIMTGPRPKPDSLPLPDLRLADDVGYGARVLLDASFTYPVATAMLRKALVGRMLEHSGQRIRIRDVRLTGIGGGKVALKVQISGAVRGRLFFTGTPSYDSRTRQITVPDLDYDVGTAQVLVRGYELLNDVELRDFLRAKARLPDTTVVRRLSQLAEDGMNRKLPARGTRLSGRIHTAGVLAVRATVDEIRVRALADADLTLSIDRSPSFPRPPAASDHEQEGEPDP